MSSSSQSLDSLIVVDLSSNWTSLSTPVLWALAGLVDAINDIGKISINHSASLAIVVNAFMSANQERRAAFTRVFRKHVPLDATAAEPESYCAFGQETKQVEATESVVWISHEFRQFDNGWKISGNIGIVVIPEKDTWVFADDILRIPAAACGSYIVLETLEFWKSRPAELTFERLSTALQAFAAWGAERLEKLKGPAVAYDFLESYPPKGCGSGGDGSDPLVRLGQRTTTKTETCLEFVISQEVIDFLRNTPKIWRSSTGIRVGIACNRCFRCEHDLRDGFFIPPACVNEKVDFIQCAAKNRQEKSYKLSEFFTVEQFTLLLTELSAATHAWVRQCHAEKAAAFRGLKKL